MNCIKLLTCNANQAAAAGDTWPYNRARLVEDRVRVSLSHQARGREGDYLVHLSVQQVFELAAQFHILLQPKRQIFWLEPRKLDAVRYKKYKSLVKGEVYKL